MARVPQLSAHCGPKAQPGDTNFLAAEQALAVQAVISFLNKRHGLLVGHIGRHLSLGKNTDIKAHIERGKLPVCVGGELAALCGLEHLEEFLALPTATESELETAVARLKGHGLIGKVMVRKYPERNFVISRDTYLDS